MGDNVDAVNKNTKSLIDDKEEVVLQVNAEKLSICCCLVTRMHGKIMAYENVVQFKYLRTTVTNQIL
jgi:hypothetical protein